MNKLTKVFSVVITLSVATPAGAQQAGILPAPGLGGVGKTILGGLAARKAGKACLKHKITCGILAVGGAVIIGGKLVEKSRREEVERPEGCKGAYRDLYRVVGKAEHDSTVGVL